MLPIFKVIGAGVRGALKGFPAINAIVEGIKNIRNRKNKEVVQKLSEATLEELKNNGVNLEQPPHNWVSIIFQLITVSFLLYGFSTKQVTFESVLEFLKSLM